MQKVKAYIIEKEGKKVAVIPKMSPPTYTLGPYYDDWNNHLKFLPTYKVSKDVDLGACRGVLQRQWKGWDNNWTTAPGLIDETNSYGFKFRTIFIPDAKEIDPVNQPPVAWYVCKECKQRFHVEDYVLGAAMCDGCYKAHEEDGEQSMGEPTELEQLRQWKESAMQILKEIDLQECGKIIGVPLGKSVAPEILPALKRFGLATKESEGTPAPKKVCYCGSLRVAIEAFKKAEYESVMNGEIALLPCCMFVDIEREYGAESNYKAKADDLHKRKIDICDEVMVLNVGGYVGESTRSEINYALAIGKPVKYLVPIHPFLTDNPIP